MTKPSELRKQNPAELKKRVEEAKKELMELRFQATIGQLEKNHKMQETKREVARILTILAEKERTNA
jgi:large subunit ribosomal protein L29